MTIDELKRSDWIIMDAIVGSTAFGLATETSDIDTRGVFVLPLEERIAYGAIDQVADEKNNHVYWELSKFLQLLREGNPSALEFLNSPKKCILRGEEFFNAIPKDIWITRRVLNAFLEFAKTQLSRAYGLNKKIRNPWPEEPPRVLDYCYVITWEHPPVPFRKFLETREQAYERDQKWYALAKLDHVTDGYALYWQMPEYKADVPEHEYRWAYGVVSNEEKANDIQVAPHIPKGLLPVATLFFNKNDYSHACTEHTKYWNWVKVRNETRYAETIQHGKGYDAKNTMHCIRLLNTAKTIAETGVVKVDRSDEREFLLGIKAGKYSYDEMIGMSENLVKEVEAAFDKCAFLKEPCTNEQLTGMLVDILVRLPEKFHSLIKYNFDYEPDDIE